MTNKEIKDKLEWSFSDLNFEEDTHSYFVNGDRLPSVSSKVKNHEQHTDFEAIKPFVAKKRGVSVSQITREWKETNEKACDLGHVTHSFAENYTGEEHPNTPQEIAAKKFLDELPEYYEILFKEIKMHSRKYRYAGTADLLLLDKRTNTLVIADYKTNKDLYKNYKGRTLLVPFNDLLDQPLSAYILQLSYYQIMIEEAIEIPVTNRVIVYLNKVAEYTIIPVEDVTLRLKNHMNTFEHA